MTPTHRTAIALTITSAFGAVRFEPRTQFGTPPHMVPQLCFTFDAPAELIAEIEDLYAGRDPTLAGDDSDRFFTDSSVWTNEAMLDVKERAQPASLTYSFPGPTALWGDPCCLQELNQLDALLEQMFGAGNLDLGREYMRQALASWSHLSGLTLVEGPDDDSALDISPTRSSMRGDIRLGSNTLQSCATRAAAFLPPGGGDIFFNAGAFFPDACIGGLGNQNNDFRDFRNVCAHEFGHSIGYFHSTPCDGTKLLEPSVGSGFEFLQVDEKRGVQRDYGDRFTPNQSPAAAHDFGSLTTPIDRSVIARDLSTNGNQGALNTDEDWFRFTLDASRIVTVLVEPTGGAFPTARQTFICEPAFPPIVNAQEAGDLIIEFWNGTGTTRLAFAAVQPAGIGETLVLDLAPASYLLRIRDIGPNDPGNLVVQHYDLTIRLPGALAPPEPVAGIDKRIATGQRCFFIGDMNSHVNETGATLDDTSYDWDLDGDGVFETFDTPRPSAIYDLVDVVPVTLRLTDSNNLVGFHTINVEVFDAPAIAPSSFDLVSPTDQAVLADTTPTLAWQESSGAQSYTLRIDVDSDDDGEPDALVLEQPGLMNTSFNVPLGLLNYKLSHTWSVTAINITGSTLSSSSRTFRTPVCAGDANYDKTVNFDDVTAVLGRWNFLYSPGRSGMGDSNNSGTVNLNDVTDVLGNWLNACP